MHITESLESVKYFDLSLFLTLYKSLNLAKQGPKSRIKKEYLIEQQHVVADTPTW